MSRTRRRGDKEAHDAARRPSPNGALAGRESSGEAVTAIHQLLPVLSPGDAIGQAVRRMRASFLEAGFTSEIFAEEIHQSLLGEAGPATALEASVGAGDVVLYHLSIGAPSARLFAGLGCRRAIVYHNITPAAFYRTTSPRVAYWLDRGRRDLARLAPSVELGIGDSAYNAAELQAAGCPATMVIPPPVDLARLSPRPAHPTGAPRLIFVSRLAPNKRQEELIRVLAALRACWQPEATLVLPGGWDDTETYVAGLRRLATDLGVASAVELPGRRSDRELGDLYAGATAAVCASEHEGFGMHLLEAWAFDLPLVARAAAAVPETVGDAGILLDSADPLVWGAVVDRVIRDMQLRRLLIERGRRRLGDFSEAALIDRMSELLDRLDLSGQGNPRAAPGG
jgi:glycosyltransferase involved in cell wall biosynthesis